MLLSCMAVTVVLYALSTLTQAILQSVGRMKAPIINASAAVVIHAVMMVLMELFLDVRYSLYYYVTVTVVYALLLCVLNQISVYRYLNYKQEIDKTFLRPILASVLMGGAAYGVYQGMYFLVKSNLAALAVAILLAAALYFVLIIYWNVVSEEELQSMPKGYMLIGIARKLGILKAGNKAVKPKKRKKKKRKKKKKKKI